MGSAFFMAFGIYISVRIFENFIRSRKYYIALENDQLSVFQKDHVFHITIKNIDDAQYNKHRMTIKSNSINYEFDLWGYNREKIENILSKIKAIS